MIPVVPGGAAYPLMDDPAMLRETQRAVAETGAGISDLENFAAFCDAAASFGLIGDLEFMPWSAARPNGELLARAAAEQVP